MKYATSYLPQAENLPTIAIIAGRGDKMSIIKSVALDENSARIAEQLPNFSHFVRECLYRHASNVATGECTREKWLEMDVCNPSVQPVCFTCWPNGAPKLEHIRQFRADKLSMEWLQEQAKFSNRNLIDLTNVNVAPLKAKKTPKKVGFFAQIRQKYRDKLK